MIDSASEDDLVPAVVRVARLRGLDVESGPLEAIDSTANMSAKLIALNFGTLGLIGDEGRRRLRRCIEIGATVYVRGLLSQGCAYSLSPFSNQRFASASKPCRGYYFADHPILPSAIAGERVAAMSDMLVATGLDDECIQPIVSGVDASSQELLSIFAIDVGSGRIIFDLNPDEGTYHSSLLEELSYPYTRVRSIGALAAVDWVAGRNPREATPINLVIDDRPVNYDYLSIGRLRVFLDHLEALYPGIHVDFAWTPLHANPDRRYVDLLKHYNSGFVWHGFLRHIDHRTIAGFEHELAKGRTLVHQISRRYDVRFEPVMIFPFEKDTPKADALLRQSDFIAKVRCYSEDLATPHCFRLRSLQNDNSRSDSFVTIYRYSVDQLTRDHMLALAILGMPISALAHPRDLALRRVERHNSAAVSYFDPVLRFAKTKLLRPMSLEDIASLVPLD